MRLISQNGCYDYPYEHCAVYRDENKIMCRLIGDEKAKVFAEYGSEEKAEKVMYRLLDEYECACYCNDAFDSSAQVQRPYLFMSNKVFRFPEDDEVEV